MELWIRSQDKMNLVQIKQISLNYQDNKQVIANYAPEQYENSGCFFELLGTYKTKERALEVLNEIQEILKPKTFIKFNEKEVYDEKENMVIGTLSPYETFDIKQLSTYVYEMPIE